MSCMAVHKVFFAHPALQCVVGLSVSLSPSLKHPRGWMELALCMSVMPLDLLVLHGAVDWSHVSVLASAVQVGIQAVMMMTVITC